MPSASRQRRITLVTDELLGYVRTGGIGTATSFLANTPGRMGHDVDILYVADPPATALASDWRDLYERHGVRIRLLARSGERTDPGFFARMRDVERALGDEPADVVIVQDLAAQAYTALRKRQLGLGFERTLFVVYCHGTRRWITDMAGKVRVLPGAHAISILEQASVELADVVVSPSAYLLDWMRQQGWELPERPRVIPYLTRAAATGEPQPRADVEGRRAERLVFFGRLEERKGLHTFAAALDALPAELLRQIEVEFLGAATPAWPRERIEGLLSDRTRSSLRRITFATNLDQPQALVQLTRPGTVAVMPSRGETFSNAVYECLQYGIPFVASDAGAPAELVAEADRARVLCEPTPSGVASALLRVLGSDEPWRPARPAFEATAAYDAWGDVVDLDAPSHAPAPETGDDWVVLGDVREETAETLRRAQRASGADVVTCGTRLDSGVNRYFLGDPGGLGVLRNHYGTTALVRRGLLPHDAETMPRWLVLARLALGGAKIVSIPEPLVEDTAAAEGTSTALFVVDEFERHLPRSARGLARLAAGFAAQAAATTPPARSRRRLFARA